MTNMTRIRRTSALLAATALAFTLASCSGGQSVQEACQAANDAISEVNSNTNTAIRDALDGNADYAELFTPAQEAIAKAKDDVKNEEVSAALSKVSDEFDGLVADLDGLEMPNPDDIDPTAPDAMEKLDEMQAQATEISDKLQARAGSLNDAAQEYNSVCQAG